MGFFFSFFKGFLRDVNQKWIKSVFKMHFKLLAVNLKASYHIKSNIPL